jgi:hypothetical protein
LGLTSASSSIGVFGGLGGGGGPGFFRFEFARCLAGRAGVLECANLPASAIGGGALNFNAGRGGDGVRSGDSAGDFGSGTEIDAWLDLLDGGGAGGGPLFEEMVLPVCWGLRDFILPGGADGGGGGGALGRRSLGGSLMGLVEMGSIFSTLALAAFFCSR